MGFPIPVPDLSTAMQLFQSEVTLKFQNHEKLNGTVTVRHGTTGDALNVPVSDAIEMSQVSLAPGDLPVTGVQETNKMVVPIPYVIKTTISGPENTLYNYSKIVDQARLHAIAAGRRLDKIKIDSIYNDPDFGTIETVPFTVGSNFGVNSQKMAEALGNLANQGVDTSDPMQLSMWLPAKMFQAMMADERVVNMFYNNVKPLTDGKLMQYLGTNIRILGEAGINSIPSTDLGGGVTEWLVPIVYKDAVIQTFNTEVSTTITYLPNQWRWELVTTVMSGAKLIQPRGIALLQAQTPLSALVAAQALKSRKGAK